MNTDSIDERIYSLALTEMFKKGELDDDICNKRLLKFNIERAEEAEKKLNHLIAKIEEAFKK